MQWIKKHPVFYNLQVTHHHCPGRFEWPQGKWNMRRCLLPPVYYHYRNLPVTCLLCTDFSYISDYRWMSSIVTLWRLLFWAMAWVKVVIPRWDKSGQINIQIPALMCFIEEFFSLTPFTPPTLPGVASVYFLINVHVFIQPQCDCRPKGAMGSLGSTKWCLPAAMYYFLSFNIISVCFTSKTSHSQGRNQSQWVPTLS